MLLFSCDVVSLLLTFMIVFSLSCQGDFDSDGHSDMIHFFVLILSSLELRFLYCSRFEELVVTTIWTNRHTCPNRCYNQLFKSWAGPSMSRHIVFSSGTSHPSDCGCLRLLLEELPAKLGQCQGRPAATGEQLTWISTKTNFYRDKQQRGCACLL